VHVSVVPQVHSSGDEEPVDPEEDPDVEDPPCEEGATWAEHPAAIIREKRATEGTVVRVIMAH
jgi:hypothetical protein